MNTQKLLDQTWFIIEKLHKYPPMYLSAPLRLADSEFGFDPPIRGVYEYEGLQTKMYQIEKEWNATAHNTLHNIFKDPSYVDEFHRETNEELVPAIESFYKSIKSADVSSWSNQQIADEFDRIFAKIGRAHV